MGTEVTPADLDHEFYELCFADVNGVRRSQVFTQERMPEVMSCGFRLTKIVMFLPCYADCPPKGCPYGSSGEFSVIPDKSTIRALPWKPNTAHAFVNLYDGAGNEAPDCPRGILRRALHKLGEEYNYKLTIGFEVEFMLLDKKIVSDGLPCPTVSNNYGAQNDIVVHREVLEEIVMALKGLGIAVYRFHAESAHGQLEVANGPADPVTACDNLLLTHLTIMTIAHKHGYEASFLPKLYADAAGNGRHVHMSLSKDGADVSQGNEPNDLSPEIQYFINGMLKHQSGLMVWSCGTRNSFERLQPSCWSSSYNIWGSENKEANVRVLFPTRGENNSIRFEQRCPDATANPHVAIAAMVMAGILGLRSKKLLPPETVGDPSQLSADELLEREAERLPTSLLDSIAAFEANDELKALMIEISSADFVDAVLACRRDVDQHFSKLDREAEVRCLYNSF